MYGTVAGIMAKAGQEKAMVALMEGWNETRGPKVNGAVAAYLYKFDENPGEYLMVAMFQGKATYRANAQAPEQDVWCRQFRALIDADPTWDDGEIISGGAMGK